MAMTHQHVYPDFAVIKKDCVKYDSISEYARALGIHPTTLNSYLKTAGVYQELRELMDKKKVKLFPKARNEQHISVEETLRLELEEANRELRRVRSEDIREIRVRQTIRDNVKVKVPKYKHKPYKVSKEVSDHEFVLLLSDIHAGEMISFAETNGINEYNWDVMLERLKKIYESVLSYQTNRGYPVEKLHILGLGDWLSGNIHEELRETNEVPLQEAVIQLALDIAEWMEQFIPHFKKIYFSGVVGNHPRESKTPKAKKKYSNADWTCYEILRQRLSGQSSIIFDIPKSQNHIVTVCDKKILMFHGDSVGPSAMVGVPWGGIIRHVARLRNQYSAMNLDIDHFVCGHFHEANAVGAKKIISNGSVVGPSEYGLQKFGESSPPMQMLLTFNAKRGLTDASYIDLKEIK